MNDLRQTLIRAIAQHVCETYRNTWNVMRVREVLTAIWDEHPELAGDQLADVAVTVAKDPNVMQPGAMRTDFILSKVVAAANAGTQPTAPGSRASATGVECAHGVDVGLLTSTGHPRCPYCRGVTRQERNKFVPGHEAGPSRMESAPLHRSIRMTTKRIDENGQEPELFGAVAARLYGRRLGGQHPTQVTWGGTECWRHPRRPLVPPYDECAECLDERHIANEWREANNLPVQPPVYRQEFT